VRIVGGSHKGRQIEAPEGRAVRPTTDRVRESIFNVLEHGHFLKNGLAGARVLDLFAGSGALGLEAISRGAAFATFVDNAAASRVALRKNIEALQLMGQTKIYRRDATALAELPGHIRPFNLVFLDPPYGEELGPPALISASRDGWITDQAQAVFELPAKQNPPEIEGWELEDCRRYGDSQVAFLSRA